MNDTKHRLAPLEPPYAPDVEAALAKWMPPGSPAEPLRLFRTLVLNDELASRMRPLGAGTLGGKAKVPPPVREVVIHRTCALTGAEYEWGVHAVGFGRPLGFTDEQLHSTVHGTWDDPCWDAEQSIAFRLADELHETSMVSDELWLELAARFDDAQVLELLITAGWYHVIAFVCNAAAVEHEEWAERFPPATAPAAQNREHRYELRIRWTGNLGEGTTGFRDYDRDHEIEANGAPPLPGSSDPHFRGDASRWNPEQLFVASLSQCHLLWYLHLCAVSGVVVTSYEDHAEGLMEEDQDGGGQFTSVVLHPSVSIADEAMHADALRLHDEAHAMCFIARSVHVPVRHEPQIRVAPAEPQSPAR
jgi:4-carboxymuconolactone decarboxylase